MYKDFLNVSSVDTAYHASLFGSLFPLRASVFDKFPDASKGLKMDAPGITVGDKGVTYSFAPTERTDKAVAKTQTELKDNQGTRDTAITARFKKAGGFAVAGTVAQGAFEETVKYQVKSGGASPEWVAGLLYKHSQLRAHSKLNLASMNFKSSMIYTPDFASGMRIAADSIVNMREALAGTAICKYNAGVSYGHKYGSTGVTLTTDNQVTAHHYYAVNSDTTVGVEAALLNAKNAAVAVGAAHRLNRDTTLKCKLNTELQLNLGLKRQINKNAGVILGALVNLQEPDIPNLGFKVAIKH